jgi:cell division protein FtsW
VKETKSYIKLEGDKTIWVVVFFLMLTSILVVYSATGALAYKNADGNTWYYLFKHIVFLVLGFFAMYVVHKVPYRYYSRIGQLVFYLSILMLIYTLVAGVNLNNASRWMNIGGYSLQPSDIAKLALMMHLSRQLVKCKNNLHDWKEVAWKLLTPITIICALIFPANFSTAALVLLTSVCLLLLGGVYLKHLVFYLISIAVLGAFVITLAVNIPAVQQAFPRVQTWVNRIENFSADKSENSDSVYQVTQAKIAVVNGGIKGRGPGKSIQRNTLPHPYSDYIYAIIIEEYGLIGGVSILILYMVFIFRGRRIFNHAKDDYGAYLAIGLSLSLVLQALVNMAVAVDLFPVTGQTLPLVSMGGTSIILTCIAIGLILSVSRDLTISKVKYAVI